MNAVFETLYNIFHGISAGLLSFLFFYFLGLMCLSEKFFVWLKFPAFSAFLGAAIFTLIGWYGVHYQYSFYPIFSAISLLFLVLLLFRAKSIKQWNCWKDENAPLSLRSLSFWLFTYIFFYILIYLFLPTPTSDEFLPIARIGNLDIFNYINATQHLHTVAASNIAHALPNEPATLYFYTPAVFYLHGWLAIFYHNNAMAASMPLIYNFAAAIGLMIVYYCHYFFSCSKKIAVCIASIVICGTFYRYIIGFYFLSSVIGIVIWLAFLMEILSLDFSASLKKYRFAYFFIMMRVYEWLLLLIYPVLFVANIFILMGVIGFMLYYTHRHFHFGVFLKKFAYLLFCMSLSGGLLFVLNMEYYLKHVLDSLSEFAGLTQVVWGMPLLSPLAILGIPTALTLNVHQAIFIVPGFLTFIGFLFYCHKKVNAWKPQELTLFLMATTALILYWLYFYLLGPTRYQPWKFASYFVLPLSGVFWAIFANILASFTTNSTRRKIFMGITLFCVLGNFFFYSYPTQKLLKKYEKLALLNSSDLVKHHDLVLKMSSQATTFLPVFFIPDKKLHFLSKSYYAKEDETTIPNTVPFFLESPEGCKTDKQHYEIPGLGCLYYHYSTYKKEQKK